MSKQLSISVWFIVSLSTAFMEVRPASLAAAVVHHLETAWPRDSYTPRHRRREEMAKILNKKFGIGLIKAGAGNVWTEYKSEGFNWRLAESRGRPGPPPQPPKCWGSFCNLPTTKQPKQKFLNKAKDCFKSPACSKISPVSTCPQDKIQVWLQLSKLISLYFCGRV